MIRALIFDLDGTLVNTELLHYQAWREILLQNGVAEFTTERFLDYVGTSNEKVATDYIASDGIEKSVDELVLEKQATYMKRIPKIELCDGVLEILQRYQGKMHLAVASSSHKREIIAILESHGIANYFSVVIGGDMVVKKKPDPEIYLKVQGILGVSVEECLAFEDSGHGLNAAKNAGMFGVAIPNKYTSEHDFSRADRVVGSLDEVNDTFLEQLGS